MTVLDTCLVSEFVKKIPNPGVLAWLAFQREEELFITSLALGELVKGIERLPTGPKRTALEAWLQKDLGIRFQGRILAFDTAAAHEWGRLCAQLEAQGIRMPAVDSQIAAICLHHRAAIVTRNVNDFIRSGVQVVNPWT